jgi:hypothetical protein
MGAEDKKVIIATPSIACFIVFTLVSGEPEITFCRPLRPRACDFPVGGTEVLDFSFGGNVNGFAGLILRVRFNANGPVRHIQEHASNLHGIRTRVHRTCHILAVPAQD